MANWVYVLMGALVLLLVASWLWIVVVPLVFVVAGVGKTFSQALLRSFFAHLPRRLKPHRVSVHLVSGETHSRFGPRFEKELSRVLQRAAPGASACACLRERNHSIRGSLRVWQDNRSALVDLSMPSVGAALHEIKERLRNPAALDWRVGNSECANCNSISCPLHWRQIVPQLHPVS